MATTADVLREAARLIEEGGWTQGALARTLRGLSVEPGSGQAVAWCAAGALLRASVAMASGPYRDEYARRLYRDAMEQLDAVVGQRGGAVAWNDAPGRTREEVVAALLMAAEATVLRELLGAVPCETCDSAREDAQEAYELDAARCVSGDSHDRAA